MYLNLREAADYIGDSPTTLLRAVTEGKLKGYKPRGRWKFSRSDLDKYVLSSGEHLSNQCVEDVLGSVLRK